jgi:hypothetical protein
MTRIHDVRAFGRESTSAVIRGVAAQFLSDPTVGTFIDGSRWDLLSQRLCVLG